MAAYICSASLNSVVGCIFRHLRNISDVGQLELADITNLPASTISKIESGSINITVELIFMLCSYYQISLTEFFKVLETAIQSLYDDKVFIYLTKTESVTIKEHTISMNRSTSLASAGALSDASASSLAAMGNGVLSNKSAETAHVVRDEDSNFGSGVAAVAVAASVPIMLGAGALLAISNPILGALSVFKKNKDPVIVKKYMYKNPVESLEEAIDKKISGIGEASDEEIIDLPILSAKQIYSILKDKLDSLPIEKLSEEQKNLYKQFAKSVEDDK